MNDTEDRYASMESRLHPGEFARGTWLAATELSRYGFAYVDLQPGDGTSYKISIVKPPTDKQYHQYDWQRRNRPTAPLEFGDTYFVATSFGKLYPWDGQWTDPGYVFDKWTLHRTNSPDEWTARIISRFLNELIDAIAERKKVDS